jgi:hypothetical protein
VRGFIVLRGESKGGRQEMVLSWDRSYKSLFDKLECLLQEYSLG